MPFDCKRVFDTGPPGHRLCTLREWDYDRAGGAYLIICECGERCSECWEYGPAVESLQLHWAEIVKAKAERAEHLRQVRRFVDLCKEAGINRPTRLYLLRGMREEHIKL